MRVFVCVLSMKIMKLVEYQTHLCLCIFWYYYFIKDALRVCRHCLNENMNGVQVSRFQQELVPRTAAAEYLLFLTHETSKIAQ